MHTQSTARACKALRFHSYIVLGPVALAEALDIQRGPRWPGPVASRKSNRRPQSDTRAEKHRRPDLVLLCPTPRRVIPAPPLYAHVVPRMLTPSGAMADVHRACAALPTGGVRDRYEQGLHYSRYLIQCQAMTKG